MLNIKNTLDGYLKNVEVIGNTIQDTNNLGNIRSVGDKVEGQELYNISLQTDNGNGVSEVVEILSPVQLEKVGTIADRVVYKDGVWVVEKNIETYKFDKAQETYGYILNNIWLQTENTTAFYTYYFRDNVDIKIMNKNGSAMCDILPYSYQNINQTDSPAVYSGNQYVAFRIPTSELKTVDVQGIRDWMDEKQPTIKYIRETPRFIPLPNDQQIKLRTFAGQTNIAFLTEIAGQIKAQVPKSLGATVNTHTEQIADLHNSLDRVKKLEETTVSTIETESNFTTVEATSNGYFEDVKLEGKTLVVNVNNEEVEPGTEGATLKSVGQDVEGVITKSTNINLLDAGYYNNIPLDTNTTVDKNNLITIKKNDGTGGLIVNRYPFHTTYLKPNSVMRFHAIFPKSNRTLNGIGLFVYDAVIGNTISTNPTVKHNNYVEFTVPSHGKVRLCVSGIYQDTSIGSFYLMLTNNTVGVQDSYIPHQSNKKPLIYYNNKTQTWEKPILREWDSIEKHSDGKYYYHKRSREVVLNGGENWFMYQGGNLEQTLVFGLTLDDYLEKLGNNTLLADKVNCNIPILDDIEGIFNENSHIKYRTIGFKVLKSKLSTQDVAGFKKWLQANPTTIVYQLAQEEVYECTNIDLITYNGETNYIVNSGAISPKSILKVHNNISNVVKLLQEKVSLLENTFIQGLKSVLSGDMYSLATILYPEDFTNDNTEHDIMVIPE